MPSHKPRRRRSPTGPSHRQLRAGELIRHALAEILRPETLTDERMNGVSVTLSEVRVSPDLKHALCFVEPLGGSRAEEVVAALNRSARFLRGRLARAIELRFTPQLKFLHDETFEAASKMNAILSSPRVRRDIEAAGEADGD